jgi:hypothetical protein
VRAVQLVAVLICVYLVVRIVQFVVGLGQQGGSGVLEQEPAGAGYFRGSPKKELLTTLDLCTQRGRGPQWTVVKSCGGTIATLLVVTVLAGCSAEPAECKRAEEFVGEAKLFQAAEIYARVQRDRDIACAREGLTTVTKLQADSLAETAKGRAAETAQDQRGAKTAYEAALKIDQGNADAAAGLRRVTRRPATVDPVWFRAQRLLDEGYDLEARAEVVKVLSKYPDRTVPEPLAKLNEVRPTPSVTVTAPTPVSAAPPSAESSTGATFWIVIGLVLSTVIGLALAMWRWTVSQLREIDERANSSTTALSEDLSSRVRALDERQGRFEQNVEAAISRVASDTEHRSEELNERAKRLESHVNGLQQVAQQLSAGQDRQFRETSVILSVLRAMRRPSGSSTEHYEKQSGDKGETT